MPLLAQDSKEWDDMCTRHPPPPPGTARRAFAVLTSGGDSQGACLHFSLNRTMCFFVLVTVALGVGCESSIQCPMQFAMWFFAGMNAAVRAVVRVALYNHCDAYAIYEVWFFCVLSLCAHTHTLTKQKFSHLLNYLNGVGDGVLGR